MIINRREIFAAVKHLRKGQPFTPDEVRFLDAAIDRAYQIVREEEARAPVSGRLVSQKGIDLIHSFEQCRLEAYPDPGSRDGTPWTIGWGSTGPGIHRGVRWTQQQADERFEQDLAKLASRVSALLGDSPTNQNQFDALCSLAYNIGVGALQKSTVLRKHKAGDVPGAAQAFLMWNKNDGKVMRGLTRRRLAESDIYDDPMGDGQ